MATLKKAPVSTQVQVNQNVVFTLVKSDSRGMYPPFYEIPEQDEIYMEYFDKNLGRETEGLRTIRYVKGEPSIYADEQSEGADERRATIIFRDGSLVVNSREKQLLQYLELTNHNVSNHEKGTAMRNKTPIFRSNASDHRVGLKLARQEKILSLTQAINDLTEYQIEGLAMTLKVPCDGTEQGIKAAKSRFIDMVNYDPDRFDAEFKSEKRVYKENINRFLQENLLLFKKRERVFYMNIAGQVRITDVPSWEDPVDYLVEILLKKTEIKEMYETLAKHLKKGKKPTKTVEESSAEYRLIDQCIEAGICKKAFGSIIANNMGMLGGKGSGLNGAIEYLQEESEAATQLETMLSEYKAKQDKD